jgi:hypothetical protein
MRRYKKEVLEKLLKVVDSMEPEHMNGVRNYIDLYYQEYGLQNKGILEIYFRTRTEKFI